MIVFSKEDLLQIINDKKLDDYTYISENLKSIFHEIMAIANTRGGILLSGISKEYELVGINTFEESYSILNRRIKQFLDGINLEMKTFKVNGYDIICIAIEELPIEKKLYTLNYLSFYMRGKNLVQATMKEKYYFKNINGEVDAEMSSQKGISYKFLDYELLDKFYKKASSLMNEEMNNSDIERIYNLKKDYTDRTLCKNMCFALYPQLVYPNFDVLIYDNRNKEKLVARITGHIFSMLRESLVILKRYLGLTLYINENKEVVRREAYPLPVLKESIYNALVHRDYSKYSKMNSIEIRIYDSYLKIINPGVYIYEGKLDSESLKLPANPGMKKVNDVLLETPSSERGISSIYSIMRRTGYISPEVKYENCIFEVILYSRSVYDFYTDKISVSAICKFCETPRSREELYMHFNPNGRSTPYYFINKYIVPLINNNVLKLTMLEHKNSKNQKIYTNGAK